MVRVVVVFISNHFLCYRYLLLNVAVGGDWPGPPNLLTLDGYGSMMEVQWVGIWST